MNKMSSLEGPLYFLCFPSPLYAFHLLSKLSISSLCIPSPLYAFHLLSASISFLSSWKSMRLQIDGTRLRKSMGPGFKNRWDPASNRWYCGPSNRKLRFVRMRVLVQTLQFISLSKNKQWSPDSNPRPWALEQSCEKNNALDRSTTTVRVCQHTLSPNGRCFITQVTFTS